MCDAPITTTRTAAERKRAERQRRQDIVASGGEKGLTAYKAMEALQEARELLKDDIGIGYLFDNRSSFEAFARAIADQVLPGVKRKTPFDNLLRETTSSNNPVPPLTERQLTLFEMMNRSPGADAKQDKLRQRRLAGQVCFTTLTNLAAAA